MFSRRIVHSARFLKLPLRAQILYFYLGMEADDDGAVEAFTVLQLLGLGEDDLQLLIEKNFITLLNDDLVCHITDWAENNFIRSDRYHPSVYQELIPKTEEDTSGIPMVYPGKDRLGKDRIGKGRLGEDKKGKGRQGKSQEAIAPSPSQAFPLSSESDTHNIPKPLSWGAGKDIVILSESQIEMLLQILSTELFEKYAAAVAFAEQSGKHYKKSHYDAILKMARQDGVM